MSFIATAKGANRVLEAPYLIGQVEIPSPKQNAEKTKAHSAFYIFPEPQKGKLETQIYLITFSADISLAAS